MQFNIRLPKKDENYTLVLITSDRVARLSILIAHLIDMFNTFVTMCYFMVPEGIFIAKFNTWPLKKRFFLVLISSDRVARLSILMSHLIGLFNTFVTR